MKFIITLSTLLWVLVSMTPVYASPDGTKTIYGYVENANIQPDDITLSAKLDTGAQTASLNAINIKEYSKDEQSWVSFDLPITETKLVHFEKRLARTAKIKQNLIGNDPQNSKSIARPVIMMDVCIKQQCKTIEVNLTDRSNFDYPLLLGRNALVHFDAIVDPEHKYIQTDQFDHQEADLKDAE